MSSFVAMTSVEDPQRTANIAECLARFSKSNDYYRIIELARSLRDCNLIENIPLPERAAILQYLAASYHGLRMNDLAMAEVDGLLALPGLRGGALRRARRLFSRVAPLAGRTDEAIAILEALLAEQPGSVPLRLELSRLLAHRYPERSLEILQEACGIATGTEVAIPLAEQLATLGRFEEAVNVAEEALQREPHRRILLISAATARLRQGNHEGWARHLGQFITQAGGGTPIDITDLASPEALQRLPIKTAGSSTDDPARVIVVMTSYNAAETIATAVHSVLAQSYPALRLIVVDDASTDGTPDILRSLAATDRRLVLMHSPSNVGTFRCRNLAMAIHAAEFYAFHDSDDWMHPDRIARHVAWMDQHPDAMLSNSKWFRMTPDGAAVLLGGGQYVMNNPASVFVRATALQRVGLFEPGRWGSDSEFIWRMRRVFGVAAVQTIDLVLAVGLARPDSLTRSYVPTDRDGRSDVRTAYNQAWLSWHLSQPEGGELLMPTEPEQRPFVLPREIDDAAPALPRGVVATMATGDYARIWAFAIDSQRRYAAQHGLVHSMFSEDCDGLNAKWSKLVQARRIVSEGSHVLLIDADASISDGCPDFTAVVAQHPEKDIFYVVGNSGRPNSGVLMLRGGSQSLALGFLDDCLRARETPVPTESFVTADGENGHVIHALRQSPFREASMELERLWNCTHPDAARLAYVRHYTNQLGKLVRGASDVRTMEPKIFFSPVSSKSLYARLLLEPLASRYSPVFVEEGGLAEATARLELGIPLLVHVHWEEFFLQDVAIEDGHAAWAAVEAVKASIAGYRAAGGRLIWTVHNTLPHQIPHLEPFLALRRHLAEVADVVLLHSKAAIDILRQQVPLVSGRVEHLSHPSYAGLYEPAGLAEAALAGALPTEKLILGFGRIESRKGFDAMIEALSADVLADVGARIRIAGHGRHGHALRQRFSGRADVEWDLRYIPEDEVGPLFRRSTCIVLPYERFLTSGIAMLALTLGTVIVAPAAPQFRELLPEVAQRFLYREGDRQDLQRAVLEALALSPAESREIRRAGLAVAAALSPATIAARLGGIYDEELAATIPRSPRWQDKLAGLDTIALLPDSSSPVFGTWPSTDLLAENWGDKLNPVLMALMSGRRVLHVREAPRSDETIIHRVIGSGLADAKPRETVWGAGFIQSNAVAPTVRQICAVRGPLTRDRLIAQDVECPEIYGDAALLMPLFYRPDIVPSWDLGIIQHFREAGSVPLPQMPDGMRVKVINILGSITGVIDDILSCRQIVSSSLHGLIAAHAYGVPATWIKFGDRALGDGFKFRDYWASAGWPRAQPIWVDGQTSCADLVGRLTTVRPLIDIAALIGACPFIDPARKHALQRRAAEVYPAMPDVSFLAVAVPDAATMTPGTLTPETRDERPLVSVIIAIRNWGLDRLELSLRSIREGEAGDRMEIVLCDFGSEDRHAVAALGERFGCRNVYVEAQQWSRSQAINAAVPYATAPYIITGDADILFGPRTLVTMRAHMDAVPNAIHAVNYFDLPQEFSVEGIRARPSFPWDEFTTTSSVRPRWGMGCAACSIAVFDTVRGYDERMMVWGAEDKDFVARGQRNGFPVHWIDDPDVRLYHVWHKPFLTGGKSHVDIHVYNKRLMADAHLERNYLPDIKLRTREPLVSIVIATHNRSALLQESIASVLSQTLQDFEIIIVDDGSTHETALVVQSFGDPRIRLERLETRGGVPKARNIGNRLARGKYIAVHDDDDLMFPDRLERQIAAIMPGDAGSYGGWIDYTMPEEGGDLVCNPGRSPFALGPLMFSSKLQIHPALLLRREVCLQQPYEERFSGGSDYHLVSRIAMAGYRLSHCGRYVVMRRLHGSNMTRNAADRQKVAARMTRMAILGFLPSGLEKTLREEGAAAPPHPIDQRELTAQVTQLVGEDYLCATDRVPYDDDLFKTLRRRKLLRSVVLRRNKGQIAPVTILLDRRQRAIYAPLVAGREVSPGLPRLRTTLRARSFNTKLIDRYLPNNRLKTPVRPLMSSEIEFFQQFGGRILGLRFAPEDWPGFRKLIVPFHDEEPSMLSFDGDGQWNILFRMENELEFSLRAVAAMVRYQSVSVYELFEEELA